MHGSTDPDPGGRNACASNAQPKFTVALGPIGRADRVKGLTSTRPGPRRPSDRHNPSSTRSDPLRRRGAPPDPNSFSHRHTRRAGAGTAGLKLGRPLTGPVSTRGPLRRAARLALLAVALILAVAPTTAALNPILPAGHRAGVAGQALQPTDLSLRAPPPAAAAAHPGPTSQGSVAAPVRPATTGGFPPPISLGPGTGGSPVGMARISTLGPSSTLTWASGAPSEPAVPSGVRPTAVILAPMGIADFGYANASDPATFHNYSTSEFLATVHIRSLDATSSFGDNWTGFQLNVVVPFTNGSRTILYWFQNVVNLNTSTGLVAFFNNVWNFSGNRTLNCTDVIGNGTGCGWYFDSPSADAPGMDVNLTFPVNISVKLVSSIIGGVPHVQFAYDDGYGWVAYDNVSVPWAGGWTDPGFPVQEGKYYHVEFVFGGPSWGASATAHGANMTFYLSFFNGHNLQPVITAWDYGGYTAECAANLSESPLLHDPSGVPAARGTAGRENPTLLYSRPDVALLNVSSSLANGTILVNGSATSYTGGLANLTLAPGTYRIDLENASRLVATQSVTLSAGEYLGLVLNPTPEVVVAVPTANRSSSDVGQSVSFSTHASGGTGGYTYTWTGLPAGCGATGPTLRCVTPTADDLLVGVTAADSIGQTGRSGTLAFRVYSDPVLVAPAWNRTTIDVGQKAESSASLVNPGSGQDAMYWDWNSSGGGALHCTLPNPTSVVCASTVAGSFALMAEVRDGNGGEARVSTAALIVLSDPWASAPSISSGATDLGVPVDLKVDAFNGTGLYRYAWNGLPGGCSSIAAGFTCTPTSAGGFQVSVTVTDSNGFSVTTTGEALTVNPLVGVGVAGPIGSRLPGEQLSWTATGSGGTGSLSYAWLFGDGTGASGPVAQHAFARPGTYTVSVWANDSIGGSAQVQFSVEILSPSTGPTSPASSLSFSQPALALGAAGAVGVALALAWRFFRRGRGGADAMRRPE